jgi:hypothetical protein
LQSLNGWRYYYYIRKSDVWQNGQREMCSPSR